jgi:hypothetical protein
VRASAIVRNGAFSNCSNRVSAVATLVASGCCTIGPPPGPGLSEMTPWSSRNRSDSRSVPRPTSYSSSMTRSGGSRSPTALPRRLMSATMRWATSIAVFCGRVDTVAMGQNLRTAGPERDGDHP